MKTNALDHAAALCRQTGFALLSTADARGTPHLGVAAKLGAAAPGKLTVSEWFCPGTIENLKSSPRVALTVWDKDADRGYQMLGTVERMRDVGVLDGYAGIEERQRLPQVEKELTIKIEKILLFKKGPHTDSEEQETMSA